MRATVYKGNLKDGGPSDPSFTLGCQKPNQRFGLRHAGRQRIREKSAGVNPSNPLSCVGAVWPKKRRKANRACAQSNRILIRKRRRVASMSLQRHIYVSGDMQNPSRGDIEESSQSCIAGEREDLRSIH